MLPIRAVVESVGYNVDWDGSTNTVIITTVSVPVSAGAPFIANEFELRAFELTNAERARRGLPALIWCDDMARLARAHSRDMAANNFFSHVGSDGTRMGARLSSAGIPYITWAENISAGNSSADGVMAIWMESPLHRGNILNEEVTHLGIGFYRMNGSQHEFYATQKFVRPTN